MRFGSLLSGIVVGIAISCSLINLSYAADSILTLKIKPSQTDPAIKVGNSPHLIEYNTSAKPGKLLLFLAGTGGVAENGPKLFFSTAIQQGYRVISLSYIDTPAVSTTCIGKVLADDGDCAEEFRIKRIFGQNTTSVIADEPQDAIINRFVKLLTYLASTDKQGNWGKYLENGAPKWDQITVAGQSQGGGMAAFIAKRVLVGRVISFSGGWDYSGKNKIANWYFQNSTTPAERWYGTYNVAEPAAAKIAATYKAMAIPEDHIFALKLDVRPGRKAHGEGISNAAYKLQWIQLLGSGT